MEQEQRFPFSKFLRPQGKRPAIAANVSDANKANQDIGQTTPPMPLNISQEEKDIKSCIKANFLSPKASNLLVSKKKRDVEDFSNTVMDNHSKVENENLKANTKISTQEFQQKMQNKMGHHAFCAYVENKLSIAHEDDQYVCLFVPGPFNKLMLEKHYSDEIRLCVEEIYGAGVKFEIKVGELSGAGVQGLANKKNALQQDILNPAQSYAGKNKEEKQVQSDLQQQIDSQVLDRLDRYHGLGIRNSLNNLGVIDRTKSLENFVVGPSNNMAYAVCMTVSEKPGEAYHSIYIQSSTGLGKTHLLHATAGMVTQKKPELRVILTNARDFMSEMMDAMAKKSIKEFRTKYTEKVDCLLIDDIHEIRNRPGTQNEISHIFNEFIQNGKQLVFSSNRPPKEIEGLEDRVLTRLTGGLIVDIQRPDFDTRVSIVKQKTKEEDVFLPNQVIQLLAQNYVDNIRELEGAVVRLAAFSNIMKVDIDLDLAKEQLKITQVFSSEKNLDIKKITKVVADHYQIPVTDLRSKARVKHLVNPRHMAMYLSQKYLKATLMEIGEYFSNRDHTSIIHGIRKIQQQLTPNSELYFAMQDIEKHIKK